MLERFKESRDKWEEFRAFFIDLSEAFDCIDNNALITELFWYRVTPKSVKLNFSYFSNRAQGVMINSSYSRKFPVCFLNRFPVFFNFYLLLYFVTPCLVVIVKPCMELIPIKKNVILSTISHRIRCLGCYCLILIHWLVSRMWGW